jgi:hypothetical protein
LKQNRPKQAFHDAFWGKKSKKATRGGVLGGFSIEALAIGVDCTAFVQKSSLNRCVSARNCEFVSEFDQHLTII